MGAAGIANRRLANVVSITLSALEGVGGGKAISFGVIQQTNQQAGRVGCQPALASLIIAAHSCLHSAPEFSRDNRLVLSEVALALVGNLS